jgi:uncharacterized protein (DUF1330 family)
MNVGGGCLCGGVRFACAAPASLVSYCHCRMCQKATGAPFSVMANFSRDCVTWHGAPRWRRSSPFAQRGFCAECGTPLAFSYDDSEHVSLAVGAFDDPRALRPTQHGGIESRLPWAQIGPGLPEEHCADDADYRALVEASGWQAPFSCWPDTAATTALTAVVALFVVQHKRAEFDAFERQAAALLARHGGNVERRVRIAEQAAGQPYEIHVVTFPDRQAFDAYREDPGVMALQPAREDAIERTEIWLGADLAPGSSHG